MNCRSYNFFNQIDVTISFSRNCNCVEYIHSEWESFLSDKKGKTIGEININKKIEIPKEASIIINEQLFFYDKASYLIIYGKVVRISVSEEAFRIDAPENIDSFFLFYVTELLLRKYSVQENVVFLHASSFSYNEENYVVNAFGGTGKTNLLLNVIKNGGIYYSDDLIPVTKNGMLFPYPKRLNLLYYNFTSNPYLFKLLSKGRYLIWILNASEFLHKIPLYKNFLGYKIEERIKRYLYVKVNYKYLTSIKTSNSTQKIHHFIWLERTESITSEIDVSSEYFTERMNLCLSLEDRSFIDFDGYFSVIFPYYKELSKKQRKLISEIVENINIKGVTKKSSEDKEIFNFITKIR